MRAIKIENPVLNSYITDLSADYTSGTSITTRSNNSFAANDLAVFGNPTEELTELKKIDSLSGNQGLVLNSTLKFAHNKGTPVFKSIWDQVEIQGRSSSAGVFAVLTLSAIQWDNQSNKTVYFHSSGDDNWEYRFRFYNSVTGTYSEYSPTLAGVGFTKYQMGYIIRTARKLAGDVEGKVVSTDELLRAATRFKNVIRAKNPKFWFWKVDGYVNNKSIVATAGNNRYSLASITDLGVINYIEYLYNANNTNEKYILRNIDDPQFLASTRNLNRPNIDFSRTFRLLPPDDNSDRGYFEIENLILNNSVGTFYISYYKEEADYNSVDDRTYILMPEIFEDYLASIIYAAKGNDAMAEKYRKLAYGPENRQKTLALEDLTGVALLIELDKQYKATQSGPRSLMSFRGQKGASRLYGSRYHGNPDYYRENYFRDEI